MKKVLICPLDWGLGHATRCIPVIRAFQRTGCEPFIASSGDALTLLQLEFPSLTFFSLPPYRPVYSRHHRMGLKIFVQLPKFARVTHEEHERIESIVRSHDIDLVVSDNRYGCWSLSVKSVFISHQIRLLMPKGFGWAGPIVNFLLHRYIRKYDEVWIPDEPGSGLTAPFISRSIHHQKFIGWLSRFEPTVSSSHKYEIIALVSGPEPQRGLFEKILTDQLVASGRTALLVAGEPGKNYRRQQGCVEVVSHLAWHELEHALVSSDIVISRSGYSTVMDLIALGKRAIFVPTPQQPEQLALAKLLDERQICLAVSQNEFNLDEAVKKSSAYKGLSAFKMETGRLEEAIRNLLV